MDKRRAGQVPTLAALAALLAMAAIAPRPVVAAELCEERGTRPVELVAKARAEGETFAPRTLVVPAAGVDLDALLGTALPAASLLEVDAAARSALLAERPRTLALPLTGPGGREVVLDLVRVEIETPDFSVRASGSGDRPVAYERGVHYRGAVAGEPDSVAALSVFRDEVMGIYRDAADGAVVLGRVAGDRLGRHVLYPEWALGSEPPWSCATADKPRTGVEDAEEALFAAIGRETGAQSTLDPMAVAAKCVRIYIETDYDIYQNKGSVSAVTNYVTGVFNQSATLYANESIPLSLSQVYVWSTNDPYTGTDSSTMLSQFQSYRNSFNGDLGHLVAFHGGGGIAAGFSGFCNSNIDNRQCFSGISSTYSNVPTYSWTVQVFTHEMGHLMGSRHTHACVWNGNNTQIDGCYTPEGSCAQLGYPSGGGTIMSYCHLSGRPGINFNNGFGTQPGNLIRSRFNAATCLNNCGGGGGCGGTTYTGTLSGAGVSQYQPDNSYYYSSISGAHTGNLTGPASADFDLYLQKWNGSAWANVASSLGSTSTESINYNGSSGYYRWRIYSYSGSGSYSLCATRP